MNSALRFTRTRIAPTPSGFLHLGNAFSFALTAALARKTGASIFLRIDDLDAARVRKEYVQDIFDTLHFLAIPWDEGPADYEEYQRQYSQLQRMDLYGKFLKQLQKGNHVFACACSRSQLANAGRYPGNCREKNIALTAPNTAWRLHTNDNTVLTIKDISCNANHYTLPDSMQDFVVRKKDGYPAYQLASMADDVHFGVDLIVRGEDLFPSTLAQLYLAQTLQCDQFLHATFYHHPLLLESGNKKMSKSAGSTSIQYLRSQGKSSEAIYEMIGAMAGCKQPVYNWESLGAAIGL
jgi:Glutamyl- and glutaminyl-tRNA synthetases